MHVDIQNIESVLSLYDTINTKGFDIVASLDNSFVEKVALLQMGINRGYYWFSGVSKIPIPEVTGYSMNPDSLSIIIQYILTHKPRTIVELGSGLSTVIIAQILSEALPHSTLLSFDGEKKYQDELLPFLTQQESFNQLRVHMHEAPLITQQFSSYSQLWFHTQVLQTHLQDKSIDLLIVDAPQGYLQSLSRLPALEVCLPYVSDTAAVFLDDAHRPDETHIAHTWETMTSCTSKLYNTVEGIRLFTHMKT